MHLKQPHLSWPKRGKKHRVSKGLSEALGGTLGALGIEKRDDDTGTQRRIQGVGKNSADKNLRY
jgi:hypothetical protein